jgi:RES domain-containing protein
MMPLPGALGGQGLIAWRLDKKVYAKDWDSGEGAFRVGGRWNSVGTRAVYCALDPATAVLENAVHKTFQTLDEVPHVLTAFEITDPASVYVVRPDSLPNANWLRQHIPSAGQQSFGDKLLSQHKFIVVPSAVSAHSWNVIFVASLAAGAYSVLFQEDFALDTRLNPPAAQEDAA